MGFDIPMNTKGALDSSSLMSLNSGSTGGAPDSSNNGNNFNSGMQQNGYNNGNNFNNGMQQNGYDNGNNFNNGMQQNGYNNGNNFSNGMQQNGCNNGNNFNSGMQQNGYDNGNNNNGTRQRSNGGGAGVHLKKGQKFALSGQGGSQLTRIKMGLGWDVLNRACDLDASAFMLDERGRIVNGDESWFVFYGQAVSPDGSVRHSGDSDGRDDGDDETVFINLERVNPQVQRIAFVVTIDEALTRGLNFSMVQNAYVRIVDDTCGAEIARFNLTDYYSNVTAMVVGELYRNKGAWKFNPVGDGVAKDLAGLCAMYGVQVAD